MKDEGCSSASSFSSFILPPLSFSLVDPTGLKPAPHGLKGRRSVTRAPDQKLVIGHLTFIICHFESVFSIAKHLDHFLNDN